MFEVCPDRDRVLAWYQEQHDHLHTDVPRLLQGYPGEAAPLSYLKALTL